MVFLGSMQSRWSIVAIEYQAAKMEEVFAMNLDCSSLSSDSVLPFSGGYIGVLSYDDFCPGIDSTCESFCYRIFKALLHDRVSGANYVVSNGLPSNHAYRVDIDEVLNSATGKVSENLEIELSGVESDDDYLGNVKRILGDIEEGRFYQLNLLRYFKLKRRLSRAEVLLKIWNHGGPYSSWVQSEGYSVGSFSPEQFISFRPDGHQLIAETFPIKGTIRSSANFGEDALLQEELLNSTKDRAELSMIVDLMKNDMNRISYQGSVKVNKSCEIKSFEYVHHLQGHVSAILNSELSMKDIFDATLPAGSITGAPKLEVMKGINEYESQPRGYFMGNSFYLDPYQKTFDSSVLIRTIVSSSEGESKYAAGSGIVIKSEPRSEMNEIWTKCKVLNQ